MVVTNEVMEGYITMKKILAMLTVIVMLGCMLSVTGLCRRRLCPSPKHDDNTDTTPTSPQTGYDLGIGSVVMTIAVSGGVAYVCTKKARARGIKRPHFIKKEPHKCCAVYGAFFPF